MGSGVDPSVEGPRSVGEASMAPLRQSRPHSGVTFQVKGPKTLYAVPFSVCVCVCVCMYIHINMYIFMYIYIYMYMYIYIFTYIYIYMYTYVYIYYK